MTRLYAVPTSIAESLSDRLHTARTGAIVYVQGGDETSDFKGLDTALSIAAQDTPTVLISCCPARTFYGDLRWHAAFGYPRVVFQQIPCEVSVLLEALDRAHASARPANPLANRLLEICIKEGKIHELQRDLSPAGNERGERWEKGQICATRIWRADSDETLMGFAETRGRRDLRTPFLGQRLPGVFVDFDRTLLKGNALNTALLRQINELASMHPITVWTGGDVTRAQKALSFYRVPWQVASKLLFRGAVVANAFDDEPLDLIKVWGIVAESVIIS